MDRYEGDTYSRISVVVDMSEGGENEEVFVYVHRNKQELYDTWDYQEYLDTNEGEWINSTLPARLEEESSATLVVGNEEEEETKS